ncbi:hypothetical protein GCM10027258_63160 [Amycolatopsis stemonae]
MARTILKLPTDGARIRELRELRGWHQGDVTERTARRGARIPRSRLSRIENGHERPTAPQLKALAQVFRVKVADLLQQQPVTDEPEAVAL